MIYTLWTLLEAMLEAGTDHGLAGIERVVGSPLQVHEERENWVFYRGTAPPIGDGLELSDLRFTLRKDARQLGGSFEVRGRCIRRDEIEARYPDIRFYLAPSNPTAPAAPAYWRAHIKGEPVLLGFRNDKPDCLSSVSMRFEPRKAP